jgi:hypothetical protein
MIRKQLRHGLLIALFAPALFSAACKKTETIAPPAIPATQILEYTITNVPETEQPIRAVVNNEAASIMLYLPAYLQLPVLMPDIKLTEGASITPASGTQIDDLLNKMRKGEKIRYSVKGKDGAVKEYSLDIIPQQAPTVVDELSTDPANPRTYTLTTETYAYFDIDFTGQNFIVENREEMMSVVLIDASGKELSPLPGGGVYHAYATHKAFRAQVIRSNTSYFNQLAADGLYKVKVCNYGQVVTLKNPIRIIKN